MLNSTAQPAFASGMMDRRRWWGLEEWHGSLRAAVSKGLRVLHK